MISNEIDTLKPSKIHIKTTPIKHLSRFTRNYLFLEQITTHYTVKTQ